MPFEPIYLLYAAIFLGALLLVEGIYYLIVDNVVAPREINRRMQMLSAGQTHRDVYESLLRKDKKRKGDRSVLGEIYDWLDTLLTNAGTQVETRQVMILMGVGTVAVGIGGFLFAQIGMIPGWLGTPTVLAIGAPTLCIGVPILAFYRIKKSRNGKLNEQLPEALDVMVRSLGAGHPVSAAMNMVTREMPDPIGTEFGICVDEMTYGLELPEALANMAHRVDCDDFKYVVVAISIQHQTGGNLAEVLGGLADIIRQRFRMFKKVKALSAEGRLSMKILAVMPFAFAFFATTLNPTFYIDVIDDPLFIPLVIGALILELLGIVIMLKLVNFKV